MEDIQKKIKPYLQALPDMFVYQIATKIIVGAWLFLLGRIFQMLLKSSGRVAVTSGDFMFLFTTWQGILILLLGIVSLFLYVGFDLNTKVVMCRNIVTGKVVPFESTFKEGFRSMKRLIDIRGLLVVLYIALVAPVLGIGLSVTATRNFYIPTFIAVAIKDSVLYSVLSLIAVIILLAVGIGNLFILHGIVIDDLPIGEASRQSRKLIKENWKDYLKQNVLAIATISCLIAGLSAVFLFLPLKLIDVLLPAGAVSRFLTVLFATAGVIISALAALFAVPLYLMKMTQLFYSYKEGKPFEYKGITREKQVGYKKWFAVALIAALGCVVVTDVFFDQLFPEETNVKIVAHRAGGFEAPENTVVGIEAAWRAGAYGSEIDIQRTKDGYYVVNHDGTFKRTAGDGRKPEEMTLKEVKKLSVDGEHVASFEEMLIACKGKIVLFTELKGKTCDKKMADDAVALVKQYKMEDECVLISLQYDVIDYIETNYPDMQTGFLAFASFGNTAGLNCDYLALEEESATSDTVKNIHDEGKQALVWTVNKKGSQKYFLCSNADGIITDNPSQAAEVAKSLSHRSDIDRMVDKIKTVF